MAPEFPSFPGRETSTMYRLRPESQRTGLPRWGGKPGANANRRFPSAGRRWWVASTTGRPDCQPAEAVQLAVWAGRWRSGDVFHTGAQIGRHTYTSLLYRTFRSRTAMFTESTKDTQFTNVHTGFQFCGYREENQGQRWWLPPYSGLRSLRGMSETNADCGVQAMHAK